MNTESEDMAAFFAALFRQTHDRQAALEAMFTAVVAKGYLSRVVLHRYRCRPPCNKVIATVIGVGGLVLVRTRDYKMSPGLNAATSTQTARERNTLDGERHWPGHVFDVHAIADWDEVGAGITAQCHARATLNGARILRDIEGKRPGHPGAPTFLQ